MYSLKTSPRHPSTTAGPHAPRRRGILVVDDDTWVGSLLGTYFRQQGLPVWLASDGEEALEIYQEFHDEIAFVAMEMRLPGMGGPETLAHLREINPNVVCYFMTADWTRDAYLNVIQTGAVALVVKPFLFGFLSAVQEHLVTGCQSV